MSPRRPSTRQPNKYVKGLAQGSYPRPWQGGAARLSFSGNRF